MLWRFKIKDLIISWNEDKGFYCEEFASEYFYSVLESLVHKYNLNYHRTKEEVVGEIELFELIKVKNPDYNIQLLEEDGSEWIYG